LTKAFEDARATGEPITDIAKKLDLSVNDVVLDSSGNGPDGKPVVVPGVPADALAKGAFGSDVGVENDALRLPSGGYAWYDVVAITKQRQKAFDEVKAEVEADWNRYQVRTKLIAKARELSEQAAKGEPIADLAKNAGKEVKTSQPLRRGDAEPGLPLSAVDQAFALADGGAGSAALGDGTSSVVFQVTKVTPPAPLDTATAESIRSKLAEAIANDNAEQFIAGIGTALGSTFDRKAVSELAGGSADVGQ
jgi:peptidyl-prolyl cis-trans isomerase D